jgi:hypothetical protein
MPDDGVEALIGRSGWIVDGPVAAYAPEPGNWCARVRRVAQPSRGSERFHVAIISPRGTAAYAQFASSIGEAARVAEGQVRGKLARSTQPGPSG